MSINVFGAKVEHPSEKIIEECIEEGMTDVDGNLFEAITVRSLQMVSNNTSTHGFEDTFIYANERPVRIEHRTPGRIKWISQRMGNPKGVLAKTPKNVQALASIYYYPILKITDPIADAEIRALADKRRSQMSKDELRFEDIQIKKMSHDRLSDAEDKEEEEIRIRLMGDRDEGRLVNREGKGLKEVAKEIEEHEMKKREIALRRGESDLEKREQKLAAKTTAIVEAGGNITQYAYGDLMAPDKKVFALKKIARTEFGLAPAPEAKKKEVVDMILAEQERRNEAAREKVEPLAVTG